MKLLYATNNNSKVFNMKERLKGLPIEIITPKDLSEQLSVVEDGTTPGVNAIKKATAYYNKFKIPTIAGDSGLYISNLPENLQPGLFVRRVNGKYLNDEEMIDYYSNLVKMYGGQNLAYYITGLALVTDNGTYTVEIKEDEFIITSTRDKNGKHRGNPLDEISINPSSGKYFTDESDNNEQKPNNSFDKACIKFITECLKQE